MVFIFRAAAIAFFLRCYFPTSLNNLLVYTYEGEISSVLSIIRSKVYPDPSCTVCSGMGCTLYSRINCTVLSGIFRKPEFLT